MKFLLTLMLVSFSAFASPYEKTLHCETEDGVEFTVTAVVINQNKYQVLLADHQLLPVPLNYFSVNFNRQGGIRNISLKAGHHAIDITNAEGPWRGKYWLNFFSRSLECSEVK